MKFLAWCLSAVRDPRSGCAQRNCQLIAVLLPLVIQQLLLPRNLIPSFSWKRQPKEGSVCACVKVTMSHLNVEVFVLALVRSEFYCMALMLSVYVKETNGHFMLWTHWNAWNLDVWKVSSPRDAALLHLLLSFKPHSVNYSWRSHNHAHNYANTSLEWNLGIWYWLYQSCLILSMCLKVLFHSKSKLRKIKFCLVWSISKLLCCFLFWSFKMLTILSIYIIIP